MNPNSNILYYDNIMIPDRNAVFMSNQIELQKPFNSFDNLLNAIDIAKIAKLDAGIIDIKIFNNIISKFDIIKQSDLNALKGKTIKEVKDELCKKALVRKILISPNKTEIYGEVFTLRGELNYIHHFLFDYDVLYGANKSYKPGDFCLSSVYKNTYALPENAKEKLINLTDMEFRIDADSAVSGDSIYNGEKDIYACISGEICYMQDNSGIVPKKIGDELTYYGFNTLKFIPKSSIKSVIMTTSGSIFRMW